MRSSLSFACLLFATCGSDPRPAGPPAPAAKAAQPLLLEHDFGVIPHGETRQHEFALDLSLLPGTFVPLRVHLDCSCGVADLRVVAADGSERAITGSGLVSELPQAGDRLLLRVVIDTSNKEALDLPSTTSRGYLLLQPPDDQTGTGRIQWPIRLRFGIECPVLLRPFASLDFGRVPQSQTPELLTVVSGDAAHPQVAFGPVQSSDPALTASLEPGEQGTRLRVRCRPGEPGHQRALLAITTDLPSGYRVLLPVTWKVVPDLEAVPMAKVSFRTALDRAQAKEAIQSQFVLVQDHDLRRPAEFAVQRLVGADGRDLSRHFEVTFVPIPEQPRQQRMFVRYTGGLQEMVRASIVLTKNGDDGPFLPIELVVFPTKDA